MAKATFLLLAQHGKLLVISALSQEEIAARGGLPEGTIFMAKPVNLQWFNGFFTALIAGRKLEHQAA